MEPPFIFEKKGGGRRRERRKEEEINLPSNHFQIHHCPPPAPSIGILHHPAGSAITADLAARNP